MDLGIIERIANAMLVQVIRSQNTVTFKPFPVGDMMEIAAMRHNENW